MWTHRHAPGAAPAGPSRRSAPRRASRVRHGERGTTILEAAVITPIFLMLITGIFEAGLFMQTNLGVANTVRAGARSASAAGADAYADLHIVHSIAEESSAIPRDVIEYIVVYRADDYGATPGEVGEDGISPGCLAGRPVAGRCNVYTVADFDRAAAQLAEIKRVEAEADAGRTAVRDESKIWFGCQTTGPRANQSPDRFWCPTDRNVGQSSNDGRGPDFVGVYMKVEHQWVTKVFGSSKRITDLSVIRMEPRDL